MSIYLVKNIFGQYRTIVPDNKTDADILNDAYGRELSQIWKTIKFHWDTEEGDGKRNLFLYLGSIPVIDERGKNVIKQVVDNVEFLPIDIDGEDWFVANVCNTIEGILNLSKSSVDRFNYGSIKWIKKFVFNKDTAPSSLFRIKELKTAVFALDSFKQAVSDASLLGLRFEECKTRTSWF